MSNHPRGKRAGAKVAARTPAKFDEGFATALAAFVIHGGLESLKAQEFVAAESGDPILRTDALKKATESAMDAIWEARLPALTIVMPVTRAVIFIKERHPTMIVPGGAIWDTICAVSQRMRADEPITPDQVDVLAKRALIQNIHAATVGHRAVALGPTFSALMAQTFAMRAPDIPVPPAPAAPPVEDAA